MYEKNTEIYKQNLDGKGKEFFFVDGADELYNREFVIQIKHVPSGKEIKFKAFITAFNDTYAQDWNSEQVFGRADPLYNFKQTTRRISLGFKMPAASEGEAYSNLAKAQMLAQFMYPNYTDVGGANILSQGPLLRLKIMNLLRKSQTSTGDSKSGQSLYDSYVDGGEGILGFFSDVTFNYNLENEHGVFQKIDSAGNPQPGTILPKLIEVSVGGFNPIHEHLLGWQVDFKRDSKNELIIDEKTGRPVISRVYFGEDRSFPYGANTIAKNGTSAGTSYSALQKAEQEKRKAEAAIANAQARYAGMFGEARRKRDEKRLGEGGKGFKQESKAAYVASALAGQAGIDAGALKDKQLDENEISQINSIYDGYVED